MASRDDIVVRRYIDKRDIYSLSTRTKGKDVDVPAYRFNSIERKMIIEYNQPMGEVWIKAEAIMVLYVVPKNIGNIYYLILPL